MNLVIISMHEFIVREQIFVPRNFLKSSIAACWINLWLVNKGVLYIMLFAGNAE